MFDLRSDPFERREESFNYNDWFVEQVPFQYAAQAIVHEWSESFENSHPAKGCKLHSQLNRREADAERLGGRPSTFAV